MNDEHALLEHRIAWLEREMVRLIWALLSAGSLLSGGAAYRLTVDTMGVIGAIGIAVVVGVMLLGICTATNLGEPLSTLRTWTREARRWPFSHPARLDPG